MVSDAFNSLVLLTGYWPCPKELQRFPFFHQPIVPMVDNTNCWFCCLSILAHIYSRRTMILRRTLVRKECAKLFWMQPYPLFSKLTIFTFLVKKKLFCNFHREISGENDGSRENDCLSWERSLIEMCEKRCHVTSEGGAWPCSYVCWAKNVLKHGQWERWVT